MRGYQIKKAVGYCDLCASRGEDTDKKTVEVVVVSSQKLISLFICKSHAKEIYGEFKGD